MRIIVDSREQRPFTFKAPCYAGTVTLRGKLSTGDYSLPMLESRIAIERKSMDDLAMCLGRERSRFERELARAAGLDAFAVVVEGSWIDLAHAKYRSKLNPHSACQSVLAFSARYGTSFIFASTRNGAEYATFGFLKQYLSGLKKSLVAIKAAEYVASEQGKGV